MRIDTDHWVSDSKTAPLPAYPTWESMRTDLVPIDGKDLREGDVIVTSAFPPVKVVHIVKRDVYGVTWESKDSRLSYRRTSGIARLTVERAS